MIIIKTIIIIIIKIVVIIKIIIMIMVYSMEPTIWLFMHLSKLSRLLQLREIK